MRSGWKTVVKSRERYLELLAKVESVVAALKVEKELEQILKIDLLKSKVEHFEHLVIYSAIEVNIKER